MPLRRPTDNELQFLEYMIRQARLKLPGTWKESIKVSPMDEANMGSLLLFPDGTIDDKRSFGKMIYEYEFKDVDRINVIASLNLDQYGELFELDIWKATFDPLQAFPVMNAD